MSAFQNQPWETNIYLSLADVPALGVIFSQLTVQYRKFGQTEFSTRDLVSGDLIELGQGFYVLKWPVGYVDTLGPFFYILTGSPFDNFLSDEFIITPLPPVLMGPADTCFVSGNIVDVLGYGGHNQISVRALQLPVETTDGRLISGEYRKTRPDADGNFSIRLLQGQTLLFEVEGASISYQITVPNAPTANIVDLLPPPPL